MKRVAGAVVYELRRQSWTNLVPEDIVICSKYLNRTPWGDADFDIVVGSGYPHIVTLPRQACVQAITG
jgi:hypothetical protein